MNATELLGVKNPGDLFPRDPAQAKKKFRELALHWHPDAGGDSHVFDHIRKLYDLALKTMADGLVWESKHQIHIETNSKKHYELHYYRKHEFELGIFYVGQEHVTYLLEKQHRELFRNALHTINMFTFPSDRVKKEMARQLPMSHTAFELTDGRLGLQVHKSADFILLRDIVDHLKVVDPKHVAWMVSRLHNIACYLHVTRTVHHDIGLDSVFINPGDHSAALLGGWWYAKPSGSKLEKIPRRTYGLLPWSVQNSKKASRATDMELVRATGRELMGTQATPEPLKEYLKTTNSDGAIKNYEVWSSVLEKSFGPRRFTELKITPEDVYN